MLLQCRVSGSQRTGGGSDRSRNVGVLDGRDDRAGNHVGVSIGRRATILKPAFPTGFDGVNWNSNRCTTIRNTVAEHVNRLSLVQTRQTLVVVGTINVDVVLDPRLECLADSVVDFFAAAGAERGVTEVGMHAAAVPVAWDRFGFPVDAHVVSLSNSLEKVACDPDLIACLFCAFGENLVFPLTHHPLRR